MFLSHVHPKQGKVRPVLFLIPVNYALVNLVSVYVYVCMFVLVFCMFVNTKTTMTQGKTKATKSLITTRL